VADAGIGDDLGGTVISELMPPPRLPSGGHHAPSRSRSPGHSTRGRSEPTAAHRTGKGDHGPWEREDRWRRARRRRRVPRRRVPMSSIASWPS
jgi:hypothetical protein